ncbi:MAG: hypothetical protein NTX82_05445 [Candidatus Parcubacteria bacterium]|nr:hypothetical protein [Candidatus Parcubacteria bacterium]
MDATKHCFVVQGRVCFPSGEIDPDNCTLADFRSIVGRGPLTFSGERSNQLIFPHVLGNLSLFFLPDEEIDEQAKVQMFWIQLKEKIPLGQLIRQYKIQPKLIVQEVDDGSGGSEMVYTALFSPTFGVEFDLQTKLVSTYVFANMSHVLNCPCPSCTLVRQQFGLPHTA